MNPYVISHTPLKRACLPVPAHSHLWSSSTTNITYYIQRRSICQEEFPRMSGVNAVKSQLLFVHYQQKRFYPLYTRLRLCRSSAKRKDYCISLIMFSSRNVMRSPRELPWSFIVIVYIYILGENRNFSTFNIPTALITSLLPKSDNPLGFRYIIVYR